MDSAVPVSGEVRRDAHGVPHLRAPSVAALFALQGRVAAHDRAWQLEIERLRSVGRTAELLGPAGVAWDAFARRAQLDLLARRAFDVLDAETRAALAAYAGGVETGLREAACPELRALGPAPGRWHPWTPLGIFTVQHVLFGSFPSALFHARARRVLGPEADLFRTEGLAGGSNAFVLAGSRTRSGLPLIAGDPHRLLEDPGVYAQVRLQCTGPGDPFDVVGLTFPGVPGVQHFGHAGEVAWGVTNAMAAYQQAHEVSLRRRSEEVLVDGEPARVEHQRVAVRGAAPVSIEVLDTARGPVVLGDSDQGAGVVLDSPAHLLGDLGFAALLPLLRSRRVDDVAQALRAWVEPVNNWLIADTAGDVRHLVAGRMPRRDSEGGIVGWVEPLPDREPGPDGVLVTANDRATPAFDVLTDDFAPPFRARRLGELLGPDRLLDAADAAAALADVTSASSRVLLDLVPADLRPPLTEGWDGAMDDSPGAAWYAALREEVVERLCAAPALAPLREPSPYGPIVEPWSHLPVRVAVSLHVILSAERPFGLDAAHVVAEAARAVRHGEHPPWPQRHRFHPLHALEQFGLPHEPRTPPTPLSGDTDTVRCTAWLPGSEVCVRASAARWVWDLADRDAGGWVVPLGAAGDPASPHAHDQHATWAAGGVLPLTTAWEDLRPDPLEHP